MILTCILKIVIKDSLKNVQIQVVQDIAIECASACNLLTLIYCGSFGSSQFLLMTWPPYYKSDPKKLSSPSHKWKQLYLHMLFSALLYVLLRAYRGSQSRQPIKASSLKMHGNAENECVKGECKRGFKVKM